MHLLNAIYSLLLDPLSLTLHIFRILFPVSLSLTCSLTHLSLCSCHSGFLYLSCLPPILSLSLCASFTFFLILSCSSLDLPLPNICLCLNSLCLSFFLSPRPFSLDASFCFFLYHCLIPSSLSYFILFLLSLSHTPAVSVSFFFSFYHSIYLSILFLQLFPSRCYTLCLSCFLFLLLSLSLHDH